MLDAGYKRKGAKARRRKVFAGICSMTPGSLTIPGANGLLDAQRRNKIWSELDDTRSW
jgi:hypothetical protein